MFFKYYTKRWQYIFILFHAAPKFTCEMIIPNISGCPGTVCCRKDAARSSNDIDKMKALLFYIIGTVATAFWRGRWWCGHVCPRGNMYLRLLSRYSPHRQIPPFVRTFWFGLQALRLKPLFPTFRRLPVAFGFPYGRRFSIPG